jgi:hypothetical protein
MQLNENMEFMSRVSYSSVVGSLVHLMKHTHLNLAHVDIVVNLGKEHLQIMKWIFWYLKGAKNSCLVYERYMKDMLVMLTLIILMTYIIRDLIGSYDISLKATF